MASGFVHEVHTLVALGRSYPEIHRWKDEPARRRPGRGHRRLRHRWYQSHGTLWDIDESTSELALERLRRVRTRLGPERADAYIASLGHDHLDVVWDYPDLSPAERRFTRKYWEAFHVWLVFNPAVLKCWGGVDVLAGRIHRVVDGVEMWDDDPGVTSDYARLLDRARLLVKYDRGIAFMLARYGQNARPAV
jgi:hypothetical protein